MSASYGDCHAYDMYTWRTCRTNDRCTLCLIDIDNGPGWREKRGIHNRMLKTTGSQIIKFLKIESPSIGWRKLFQQTLSWASSQHDKCKGHGERRVQDWRCDAAWFPPWILTVLHMYYLTQMPLITRSSTAQEARVENWLPYLVHTHNHSRWARYKRG